MGRAALVLTVLALCGCASMFMHGGTLVKKSYSPDVVVTYRTEGAGVPAGVTYHLVKAKSGQDAVFEQSADGSGTVITNQWREGNEDHFFCWVGRSHGYEYVIPVDRTKPGRKYVYPAGYFSVSKTGGIERPVCSVDLDPVATLIPR